MKKLFLVLVLLLSGCAHKVTRVPTGLSPNSFWAEQNVRKSQVGQFTASISLGYKGKENSVSGSGKVFAGLGAKLNVELRDPLGRVQYILNSTEASVVAYYPRTKMAYQDLFRGKKYFELVLGTPIEMELMRSLWVGVIPLQGKPLIQDWKWNAEQELYEGKLVQNGMQFHFFVDGDTAAIRKMYLQDVTHAVQVEYEEMEKSGKITFAHAVKLLMPQMGTHIHVDWDTISWALPKLAQDPFAFKPPEGVHLISLH